PPQPRKLSWQRTLPHCFALCAIALAPSISTFAQDNSIPALSPILTNNPIYQRDLWFWKQRAFPLGYIPTGARNQALDQIHLVQSQTGALGPTRPDSGPPGGPPPSGGNLWVNIGPAPVFGESQTPLSGD